MKYQRYFLPLVILAITTAWHTPLPAQSAPGAIRLQNPSFEDTPAHSSAPRGWMNCGFTGETPPDIQPVSTFGAQPLPYDGNTYLGMVTRDNETWERVGQQLPQPLQPGQCYRFSLALARSSSYLSMTRLDYQETNYNEPSLLRIWGGHDECDTRELLAVSPLIEHTKWRQYALSLQPREGPYTWLILEVYYPTSFASATTGNILLDQLSALTPTDSCSSAWSVTDERQAIVPLHVDVNVDQLVYPALEKRYLSPDSSAWDNEADWEAYLCQQLDQLTFDPQTQAVGPLTVTVFQDYAVELNVPLLRLRAALQHHPERRYTLAVAHPSAPLARQRIDAFHEAWRGDSGLHLQLRKTRRGDAGLNWLCQSPSGLWLQATGPTTPGPASK